MKLQATLLAATFMLAACANTTVETETDTKEKSAMKSAETTELCTTFGPQTPRDISNVMGTNPVEFTLAPASSELNLCNIHTHTNAEHKGPGFSVFVNDTDNGGCCDITPGEGLGSCLSDTCQDPLLRVEAQVFLVVNDPEGALDFTKMAYGGNMVDGKHQPMMIPSDTGTPVVFRGSTTGPSYDV